VSTENVASTNEQVKPGSSIIFRAAYVCGLDPDHGSIYTDLSPEQRYVVEDIAPDCRFEEWAIVDRCLYGDWSCVLIDGIETREEAETIRLHLIRGGFFKFTRGRQ
jgi:hypothetical protein